MKKTLLGLTMLALLAGCAGNLPPVDTGQLLCLALCKDGKCEKKEGAWTCVVTTPVTCPEKCPTGQACTDPKQGCVPVAPPPPSCADLACEYGCTENPPTCKPKPPVIPPPAEACVREEDLDVTVPQLAQQLQAVVVTEIRAMGDTTGQPPAVTLERLAARLRARGLCAIAGIEAVFVKRLDGYFEEYHAVYFGTGALIETGKFMGTHFDKTGGSVTPPPVTDACPAAPCPDRVWTAETLPDGWGQDAIGTARWHFNVHVHTMGNYDSTSVVDRNEPYCASIGMSPMADGTARASCPVRPDGHNEREAVEGWLLEGGPVVEGRNGQDCKANNNDNPFAFLAGTGNCRICNTPKTVCSEWK